MTLMENQIEGLTPRQIVESLDQYIIGQGQAKRMVAIALRNRNRRKRLPEAMREEISPKNIIMIGPTGVGKTEIARRLSRLAHSPFLKVEATKFTEIGYVGRDVESMVRDLMEIGLNMVRKEVTEEISPKAKARAQDRLLDILLPPPASAPPSTPDPKSGTGSGNGDDLNPQQRYRRSRAKMRQKMDAGDLDSHEVEVEIETGGGGQVEGFIGMGGLEEMTSGLKDVMEKMMPRQKRISKMSVADAKRVLFEEEVELLIDMDKVTREALERVEQSGIIFLDEFDKIAGRDGGHGPDVSREGVQRDILPIVEGSTVFTKHGMVKTDHVLFIAAGAFHSSKPSDLIPELQGRFPLRVELDTLGPGEFRRILTEPRNSLTKQYTALLATESVELVFTAEGIDEIAESAHKVNLDGENIGARRLHTIIEKILEEISFDAPEMPGKTVTVDREFVRERLQGVMEDQDLSKFIL